MKKYKYYKAMKVSYDVKQNKPIFELVEGEGYKEVIFGQDENGNKYEYTIFVEKTADSKYKWQATEATTGMHVCYGSTCTDCLDHAVMIRDRIHHAFTQAQPTAQKIIDELRKAINYVQ